jgi:hypothetical protein
MLILEVILFVNVVHKKTSLGSDQARCSGALHYDWTYAKVNL